MLATVSIVALAFASPASLRPSAPGTPLPPERYTVHIREVQIVDLLRHRFGAGGSTLRPCRAREVCKGFAPDLTLRDVTVDIRSGGVVFGTRISGAPFPSHPTPMKVSFDLNIAGDRLVMKDVDVDIPNAPLRALVLGRIVSGRGWHLVRHLARASADPALPGPRLPIAHCVLPQQLQIERARLRPARNEVEVRVLVHPAPLGTQCP